MPAHLFIDTYMSRNLQNLHFIREIEQVLGRGVEKPIRGHDPKSQFGVTMPRRSWTSRKSRKPIANSKSRYRPGYGQVRNQRSGSRGRHGMDCERGKKSSEVTMVHGFPQPTSVRFLKSNTKTAEYLSLIHISEPTRPY